MAKGRGNTSLNVSLLESFYGKCIGFVPIDALQPLVGACKICEKSSMDHIMRTTSTSPLHRLFIIIRNVRVSFASTNSAVNQRMENVDEFCRDAVLLLRDFAIFLYFRQVPMNKQDKNRIVSKIEVARKSFKPAATILTKRLAAVIALDDIYNWLYYATTLTTGHKIPTPAEYYSIFAFDPKQASLREFWKRFAHGEEMDGLFEGKETNQNPLLELFLSRWLETFAIFGEDGLKVLAMKDCLSSGEGKSLKGVLSMEDCLPSGEGTSLKGYDPLCPSLLNTWRDSGMILTKF
jgi:hypothetical protein